MFRFHRSDFVVVMGRVWWKTNNLVVEKGDELLEFAEFDATTHDHRWIMEIEALNFNVLDGGRCISTIRKYR